MILLDYSQIVISNLMMHLVLDKNPEKLVKEDLLSHMVFMSLRSYIKQFSHEYGELVVCIDSKQYWRRDVYPYYKANRAKTREASPLDWKQINIHLNQIKEDVKANLNHKCIEVHNAEADDIIAILAKRYQAHEKVLIISGDKDYAQLLQYPNVKQYSPVMKKYLRTDHPLQDLKELIITGDKSDGVPNMLSSDDCFVIGTRQKSINKKKLELWLSQDPSTFCVNDTMKRGWARNQTLVDFSKIPSDISHAIVASYEAATHGGLKQLYSFFVAKRMSQLLSLIEDFKSGK